MQIDVHTKNGSSTTYTHYLEKSNYTKGVNQNRHDSIMYTALSPEIQQTYYTPYNLNYNDTAKITDNITGVLDHKYYNKEPLSMSVNNKHNIVGSIMNTLDLNNVYTFNVQFNDGTVFGLPGNINWYQDPGTLDNDTWEYNNHAWDSVSMNYANGRGSTEYRYNTTLNAGFSGNDATSITYNGTEYTGNNYFTKQDKDKTFHGGDFTFKSILTGDYTTSNNTGSLDNWWVITYNQGKAYEYGTHYRGIVNSSGFHNPTLCSNYNGNITNTTSGASWGATFDGANIAGKSEFAFNTNGTSDRAPYVALASKKCIQPVLYGKWDVKTIAGYIK